MPTSYERKDMFGNTYTVHEDANGNIVGTSEERTDMFGNTYTRHTDRQGNLTGTSEDRTDAFGSHYTRHEDRQGNLTGTSEKRTDAFGNDYTVHRDKYGNTTGTSETRTDIFGGTYTKTTPKQSKPTLNEGAESTVIIAVIALVVLGALMIPITLEIFWDTLRNPASQWDLFACIVMFAVTELIVFFVSLHKNWKYGKTLVCILLVSLIPFLIVMVVGSLMSSLGGSLGIIGNILACALAIIPYSACMCLLGLVPALILSGISVGIRKK